MLVRGRWCRFCTDETSDLRIIEMDERRWLICKRCDEGMPRPDSIGGGSPTLVIRRSGLAGRL